MGWLLLAAGVILLGYVGYLLTLSNVIGAAKAGRSVEALRGEWQVDAAPPAPRPGKPFALAYIPRLGADWVQPIIEGSTSANGGLDVEDLSGGLGHYATSALPGEVGNFALAGHRATHGEPLADLDGVVRGDAIYVQHGREWFTYVVSRSEIVTPDRLDVLLPVPGKPDRLADRERITVTTCHPRWSSSSRLVVYGELTTRSTQAPAEVAG